MKKILPPPLHPPPCLYGQVLNISGGGTGDHITDFIVIYHNDNMTMTMWYPSLATKTWSTEYLSISDSDSAVYYHVYYAAYKESGLISHLPKSAY